MSLLLLFPANTGTTPITNVQAKSQNDNGLAGTTSALAFTSSNTAGNMLVLTIVWTPRVNNVSVTDTQGNTWATALAKQTNNNTPELSNIAIFYVQNCKAGANTVTVTASATGNFAAWTIAEFTNGTPGTWTVDKTQFGLAATASTSPSSGATATLSQADELVIGCIGTIRNNEVFTAGSGFAIPTNGSTSANNQSEALEWLESSSTAAKTATMTLGTSSTWNAAVATFTPPASGTNLTHTVDGLIQVDTSKTHTLDAVIQVDQTKTHTLDELIQVTTDKTHTADGLIQTTTDKTLTNDAIIQVDQSLTHTVTVDVQADVSLTHTLDLLIQTTTDKTHTLDAIAALDQTRTHVLDSVIQADTSKNHTLDELIQVQTDKTHSVTVDVQADVSLTHTLDASIQVTGQVDLTHTLTADIQADILKTHTLDSLIQKDSSLTLTNDVIIQIDTNKTHSLDLFVVEQPRSGTTMTQFGGFCTPIGI